MSNTPIGKHFTLGEVTHSDTAIRLGIQNELPPELLKNAIALAINVLDLIREHFGIPFSPNSWLRTEPLERAINQKAFESWCVKHSKPIDEDSWADYFSRKSHPLAEAADITIPGVKNEDIWHWVQKNLEFDQCILESSWVHVSYRAGNNRKQSLIIK